MSDVKAMMFVGGNAPNREAQLTISPQYGGTFHAYYEPGYDRCGDPDCDCHSRIITGIGDTAEQAIADYWEQWSDKYELETT